MSIIFLFVDGVGLGRRSDNNPFYNNTFQAFDMMAGNQMFFSGEESKNGENHLFKGIDATLGVKGLPQSGTGQTSLFTGINASKKIGKHFGPFPHSELKPDLKNESIFKKLLKKGRSVNFVNAYPDIYFKKASEKNRWSCTTLMAKSADLRLNTLDDVINGEAVTAGITQKAWREKLDLNVPVIEPEEAAQRILNIAGKYDFILYEYYQTDKAGHSCNMDQAVDILSIYDRFLYTIITGKKENDTVILSSDHGNLENISTKTHTRNNVPLFVHGPASVYFRNVSSITEITPRIVECF